MTENIINKTCKEQGLTYAQLGELIGYSNEAISKSARAGDISQPMMRSIELYLKVIDLEQKLKESEIVKNTIKKWIEK